MNKQINSCIHDFLCSPCKYLSCSEVTLEKIRTRHAEINLINLKTFQLLSLKLVNFFSLTVTQTRPSGLWPPDVDFCDLLYCDHVYCCPPPAQGSTDSNITSTKSAGAYKRLTGNNSSLSNACLCYFFT